MKKYGRYRFWEVKSPAKRLEEKGYARRSFEEWIVHLKKIGDNSSREQTKPCKHCPRVQTRALT